MNDSTMGDGWGRKLPQWLSLFPRPIMNYFLSFFTTYLFLVYLLSLVNIWNVLHYFSKSKSIVTRGVSSGDRNDTTIYR